MSASQNNNRDPQRGFIVGSSGSVVAPTNTDVVGFVFDLLPIFIVAAAYAVSTKFIPLGGGTVDTSAIEAPLFYSLSVSLGGAAIGLFIGLMLALAMGTATQQETDQRFLFFTMFPLMPALALLSILWFGLDSAAGGLVLGATLAACAAAPILQTAVRDPNRRLSAFVDAAFVSYFCGLGAEITREALGGATGIGSFAAKAMYTFDMTNTFFALFILALLASALALLRRTAQMVLAQKSASGQMR